MQLCINCNAPGVVREGDEFKCPKCKYEWDVAHERANAAYLASQGRKPATSVTAVPAADVSPEEKLLKELGLTSPADGAPDLEEKWRSPGDEDDADGESDESTPADETASDEPEPDAPADDGYHVNVRFDGEPDDDVEVTLDVDDVLIRLEATTVPLLKAMAEEHDVDLAGATVKADIIERLLESGKLTAVFSADGDLVDVE